MRPGAKTGIAKKMTKSVVTVKAKPEEKKSPRTAEASIFHHRRRRTKKTASAFGRRRRDKGRDAARVAQASIVGNLAKEATINLAKDNIKRSISPK